VDRKPVAEMTERELLEELVTFARNTEAQLNGLGESLANNPLLGKMFGGIASAFGK
jgi:hypothetical protein